MMIQNLLPKAKSEKPILVQKKGPVAFLNEIKKGEITMEQAKALQEDFSNYLKMIRRGKNTEKKKKTFSNINRLFNGRNDSINRRLQFNDS